MNGAGKARQKLQATAGSKFTKPGARSTSSSSFQCYLRSPEIQIPEAFSSSFPAAAAVTVRSSASWPPPSRRASRWHLAWQFEREKNSPSTFHKGCQNKLPLGDSLPSQISLQFQSVQVSVSTAHASPLTMPVHQPNPLPFCADIIYDWPLAFLPATKARLSATNLTTSPALFPLLKVC